MARRLLAASIDTPVSVGEVGAEGGTWGIAILAADSTRLTPGQSLADFLTTEVFSTVELHIEMADPSEAAGFDTFLVRYVAALPIQHAAVEHL